MTENLEISLTDVAGISKLETSIPKGKLTRVKGKSASGKSSILRGVHLALSGPIRVDDMNEAIQAEFEQLRLHDRSATGLLRDGSTKATCTVRDGATGWTTSLPKTGAMQGSGNHPLAAVMSTYLSPKPATKIYKSVFEPVAGEEDDFSWLANDMSSAAQYLSWHQHSAAVRTELEQARLRFGRHMDQVQSASARHEELDQQMKQIKQARDLLVTTTKGVTDSLKEDFNSAVSRRDKAKETYQKNNAALIELEREHGQKLQQLQIWNARLATAESDLADAEDRAMQPLTPLNVDDLVNELASLDEVLSAASGASKEAQAFIDAWEVDGTPDLRSPTLQALLESKRIPEDHADKQARKSQVQAEIVRRQNAHAAATRAQRMAADNAASSRTRINECTTTIRGLRQNLGARVESQMVKLKADVATDKSAYEESEAALEPLQAKMDAAMVGNIEAQALSNQISTLEDEIASVGSAARQVFALYLQSVGMVRSEEIEFTNEGAEALFAHLDGAGDVTAATTLVDRYLSASGNEIQSILREQFGLGTLPELLPALLSYSMQRAEEHRTKARDVFNEVGGHLFANLDQSPITTLSLDTDYRLTIEKSDGTLTGVRALSGGESALVACALLMAVQKAYAPEAPVLLFDSVLDNINPSSKENLCNFLSEYAAQENIAIVVTELVDDVASPQLA
jgi:ABC-type lipoprotein export system ATPase subunit